MEEPGLSGGQIIIMITQTRQEGPQFVKPCCSEAESSGLCKKFTLGLLEPEGISLCSINSCRFFFHEDVEFSFQPANFQYPPDLVVGLSTSHPASSEDPLLPEPPSLCLHFHVFRVFLLKQMMNNSFLPSLTV